MSYILISHRKDLDGISSAALMVRYFTKHQPGPFYLTLRDYPDGARIIEDRLLEADASQVYIADLATDQKFIDEVVSRLEKMKQKGNRITWMDHHPTRQEIIIRLKKVVDVLDLRESTTTGSQIVYERLYRMNGIEDQHASLLSALGRDSDLMEMKISVTHDLVTLIDYYNYIDAGSTFYPNLIQLALHLAFPRQEAEPESIIEAFHREQIHKYTSLLEAEKEKVISGTQIIESGGLKFAIFSYPTIFSGTRISQEVLNRLDVDASVGYSPDGSGSIRRKNPKVSCGEIAKLLGGGGHEFAAGFSMGFEIKNDEDDKKARKLILESIKKAYP